MGCSAKSSCAAPWIETGRGRPAGLDQCSRDPRGRHRGVRRRSRCGYRRWHRRRCRPPRLRVVTRCGFLVVARLRKSSRVQARLPPEIRVCVVEGYRPLALQQQYWERANAKLRSGNPQWSEAEVADEAAKYVAPPWIMPPHSTGGALDVVLLDRDGVELDMGCPLNEQCPRR